MNKKRKAKSWSRYLPNQGSIRQRLLASAMLLGVLTILSPLYIRTSLETIKNHHQEISDSWWVSAKLQELTQLLTESELFWQTHIKDPSQKMLPKIHRNIEPMRENIRQLKTALNEEMNLWSLISQIDGLFELWLRQHFEKSPDQQDAEFYPLLTKKIAQLHKELHSRSNNLNQESLRASSLALQLVTYSGILFFVAFFLLMISLWRTLIPGISQLLAAVGEFKRGNLDHRVHLSGSDETTTLARAFNEMAISVKAQNEKLKELNRLKTDFVSTVSHELRTPLTAIKGSIGLILGGVTGKLPDETEQMLRITHKNTDRLIRLINDVLDISKIEAGAIHMKFDKYSLVETIDHAVMGLEALAKSQGIKLVWNKPEVSPLVIIDRDRIEQVITNLISNSVKFTEPGGSIIVRCEWESDRVVIHIEDTGQGIPEDQLEHIFEKFHQVESSDRKAKEGSGLGLTIVKALIGEHEGSIWVNSKFGTGSDFAFSLPWNGKEYVESKKGSVQIPPFQKKQTILIVDDEKDFVTVLKRLLEHEGYKVLISDSGAKCIDIAVKNKPDLIFMDVLMPGINGIAAQTLLYQNPGTEKIPVVFVTTSNEYKDHLKIEGNVVKIFSKPVPHEELKAWLANFFVEHPSEDEKAA